MKTHNAFKSSGNIDASLLRTVKTCIEMSDLLAATSLGRATWSQKLNMFSLRDYLARCYTFVVDHPVRLRPVTHQS